LTDSEAKRWLDLFEGLYGLELGGQRLPLLRRLVVDRMCLLGMASQGDYYDYVSSGTAGNREADRLLESLANGQTELFRHRPSFEALRCHALPRLMDLKRSSGECRLTMWSAGCATGEEAYSMAAVAFDVVGSQSWPVTVLGSDINSHALDVARLGRYTLRHEVVASLPGGGRFLRHREGDRFDVSRDLRASVRFTQANLLRPDHRWPAHLDVIFCHNVLIHVQPQLRPIIAANLYRRLAKGGFLCFAPGEVLRLPGSDAERVRFGDTVMFRRAPWSAGGKVTDA